MNSFKVVTPSANKLFLSATMDDRPIWLPLESNPTVMTNFLVDIGMSAEWSVVDLIGIDEDVLGFVPQPVAAIIFLYPPTVYDSEADGDATLNDSVFFMKQMIRNACGTVALVRSPIKFTIQPNVPFHSDPCCRQQS